MDKKDILSESYELLFGKPCEYRTIVKFTDRFDEFNANIRMRPGMIELRLSKKWRKVSREIVMGLCQELLLKVFKKKGRTLYMDLYNSFIKNLHISVPKTKSHPMLEVSFEKLNDAFFSGMMEKPNLIWGDGLRKLGSYDYKKDTIMITKVLANDPELLDYVMYHEMLHKKHKFHVSGSKSFHHTGAFKRDEQRYPNHAALEQRLKKHLFKTRLKRAFFLE